MSSRFEDDLPLSNLSKRRKKHQRNMTFNQENEINNNEKKIKNEIKKEFKKEIKNDKEKNGWFSTDFKPLIHKFEIPLPNLKFNSQLGILEEVSPKNNLKLEKTEDNSKEDLDYDLISNFKVDTLEEIIKLSDFLLENKNKNLSSKLERLVKINSSLKELNQVVGLNQIKNKIVDQILYLISHCDEENPPMFHTSIEGLPGTGKTHLARILGKIIYQIGYLKKKTKSETNSMENLGKIIQDAIIRYYKQQSKI
jgi:hypothetical protein